jgi:hypothetical protein
MATGALARAIRATAERRTMDAEHCDLCRAPVEEGHRHLFDTRDGEVLCACRACSLLFADEAALEGRYRLVPRRRVRLPALDTQALGVPVGLAFFVPRPDGTVTAHYPSPAGATRWDVHDPAWRDLVAHCPQLRTLVPDVEALLVNTARGLSHHWITPVDDCFRMVAVVRREWKGMTGGGRVWSAIEEFFAELAERQ